ncbi:MAG: phosphoglucosamine mutase [Syntrophorhabdus sp.]
MGKLFGTDGVRGEANRYPMNAEIAFAIGQAMVYILKKTHERPRIVIGKDTRISGYMLEGALESGITSMGGNPYMLGVLPTPGIAFIAQSMRADAGIVISASHNPYQDNGIKIFSGNGFKLSDEQEEAIEELMLSNTLHKLVPPVREMGQAFRIDDVLGRYIVFLKNTFPRDLSIEGMKVVIDASNGATYKVAPDTFWELGADIDVIHNNPNGININDGCGSQYTRDLKKRVIENGADIGLAFDGDGDRLIAVDEKGREIAGDQILFACAKMLADQRKLENNLVVGTIMSNLGLKLACAKHGFTFHASKVGDRHVLEDMMRLGGIIGGEESGHMIFLDHHTTGDGIVTALQLMACMARTGKRLSELADLMEIYPQKLINVDVKTKPDLSTIPEIAGVIECVEKELGDNGRVLVRYSGTQNMCRVMVEGPTDEITETHCTQIAEIVRASLG